MSGINNGGCADLTWNSTFDRGMSLRDWFAGQALIGHLAGGHGMSTTYSVADSMIAERDKDLGTETQSMRDALEIIRLGVTERDDMVELACKALRQARKEG